MHICIDINMLPTMMPVISLAYTSNFLASLYISAYNKSVLCSFDPEYHKLNQSCG